MFAAMKRLLIIGASARAAAQSAHRAGFDVVAADLFADQDLTKFATCLRVTDYPMDFLAIRKQFPELSLVYTGALENYPSLIEELQSIGPVWGQSANTLRQVRDPTRWTTALSKRNITLPETRISPPTDTSEAWIVKPLRSAGGAHVRRLADNELPNGDHQFQKVLVGEPCSAGFVVDKTDRVVRFLGASRMLVGETWGASHAFGSGGCVSYQPNAEEKTQWLRIGQALVDDFDLVGVFGVDAIATKSGVVPIEVNPRYTASMETLEVSLHEPILQYHVDACLGNVPHEVEAAYQPCAKLFVYADRDLVVPDSFDEVLTPEYQLADIPTPGQTIYAGAPIATVLTTGEDVAAQKLQEAADRLRNSCVSKHV